MADMAATRSAMTPGVLAAIGNTPLVRLARLLPGADFEVFGKLECLNPGGSIKDRPARTILLDAIRTREVRQGTVVIESSSGNLAVALAQVCAYFGIRFICVVDPKTTSQNIAILRAYGAEVDVVESPDPRTGEFLPARIARVRALLEAHANAFWPNQYANLRNALAHRQTMDEVVAALDGSVDYLFCATSTCGTLRGCAEYVRARGFSTRIVAVDAVGSVIFGGRPAKRLLPGHGAAVRPALFEEGLADRVVHVTDLDCVAGCRTLARREAILAGGSSGAVVVAAHRLRAEITPGSRCVLVLADRGERYLDTVYSDAWVTAHLGEVPPLLPADRALAA
jgi:N-(2-amino-2-carboxyethyl)-L-glutamate synthase